MHPTVTVTKKGDGLKFLGPDMRAFAVKAGDTAVVMNPDYAKTLIEDGYAVAAPAHFQEPQAVTADTDDTPRSEADVVAELSEVNGIGKATATKLYAAGIQSIAGLINADSMALAKELDVTETKIISWQEAANELLEDGE